MDALLYTIKIIVYFLIIFLFYIVANKFRTKRSFLFLSIILCILFGLYSVWCGKYPYVSDRKNFAFRFEDTTGQYDSFVMNESLGLYGLESILHLFTYDATVLFFSVSFLFMLITMLAYRESSRSTPFSFLFLLLSGYPIFSFYMLKQCMAMAFISLGYGFFTRGKKIRSFLCLIVAILFHEVAWIVVPLLLALKLGKNRCLKSFLLIIMALVTIFFQKINVFMLSVASRIIPSLKGQISSYLDKAGSISSSGSGIVTVFKGLPFYYLFGVAIKERKRLSAVYEGYDDYLITTAFVSMSIVLSGFMYWMFRFGLIFYMPVSDFSSIIYSSLETRKEKALFVLFTIFLPLLLSLRLMSQYFFYYGGI